MRAEIYEKNHETQEVEYLLCMEDVISVDIVSNTAIIENEETHCYSLDNYAINIKNDVPK